MLDHVDEGEDVSLKQISTQREKENKSRRVQHPLSISLWYTVKQQLKFAKLNVPTKMAVMSSCFALGVALSGALGFACGFALGFPCRLGLLDSLLVQSFLLGFL